MRTKRHMSNVWSDIEDGTAVGPTGYIPMHDGEAVVQALWDDERGVQISVSVPDFAMTPVEIGQLRGLIDELVQTPAPKRARSV